MLCVKNFFDILCCELFHVERVVIYELICGCDDIFFRKMKKSRNDYVKNR
jgi:hypothetical protein